MPEYGVSRDTERRSARLALAVLAAQLWSLQPALAQDLPRKLEIQTNDVISHGVTCAITTEISFVGRNVLLSNIRRACGNANDRAAPSDQGLVFPINGSRTEAFTCTIDAGLSPLQSCSNGDRRQLTGLRLAGPVKSSVRQTMASRFTSAGFTLNYTATENQTVSEPNGMVERMIERAYSYDIRFEAGGCKAQAVSKVVKHDGQDRGPLSVRPFRCRVLG